MSHLDEDVLDLWITALRNTVMIQSVNGAPALIDLFPEVISLLATNLDLLGKIVTVVESYFFLDGPAILQVLALLALQPLNPNVCIRVMPSLCSTHIVPL